MIQYVALISVYYGVSQVFLYQFLGLYDYDPKTSSSSENPEFELSFKEGSMLKIFGHKMSDGYYVGEVCKKIQLIAVK